MKMGVRIKNIDYILERATFSTIMSLQLVPGIYILFSKILRGSRIGSRKGSIRGSRLGVDVLYRPHWCNNIVTEILSLFSVCLSRYVPIHFQFPMSV